MRTRGGSKKSKLALVRPTTWPRTMTVPLNGQYQTADVLSELPKAGASEMGGG